MTNAAIHFDETVEAGQQTTIVLDEKTSLSFTWCPAGVLLMGSGEEIPLAAATERSRHAVRLTRGFWIATTLVTQAQWRLVSSGSQGLTNDNPRNAALPVSALSWHEAKRFCHRLTILLADREILSKGQRIDLPSEAQWEYACRAGTETPWYFGENAADLERHGWYRDNSGGETHPVRIKDPNPWGIFDLYGNVAEWCFDDFAKYRGTGQLVDPLLLSNKSEIKVARGGAYSHLLRECSSSSREAILLDNPFNEPVGLRVVCVAENK